MSHGQINAQRQPDNYDGFGFSVASISDFSVASTSVQDAVVIEMKNLSGDEAGATETETTETKYVA